MPTRRDPDRPWVAPRTGGYSAVEQAAIVEALVGGDEYTNGVEYRRGILGWFGMKRKPCVPDLSRGSYVYQGPGLADGYEPPSASMSPRGPGARRGGYSGGRDIDDMPPPRPIVSGYLPPQPPPGRAAASPRGCTPDRHCRCHCTCPG